MDYKKLLKAHQLYYDKGGEGVRYYDEYMKHKDWRSWENPQLPPIEIMKLFGFVLSWDAHFEGVPEKFKQIYQEIYPAIQNLGQERIENINLGEEAIRKNIWEVFDKVARCSRKFESTDASKILHTILPNLFVMWDRKIREKILGDEAVMRGVDYADYFLPKMQREINEAITSCMAENNLTYEKPILRISQMADGKTLAKLIDEFNWVQYALGERI